MWLTAIDSLRVQLSDGPTDKLRAFKRCFGDINGVNLQFKTLESRRISDFTDVATDTDGIIGVYKNGVRLLSTDIDKDLLSVGFFSLKAAPVDGEVIEANYYIQWFIDSELTAFLQSASKWIGLGEDFTVIPEGLQPAALLYACAEAYQKLSLRFSESMSDTYRLNDVPDKNRFEMVKQYQDTAESYRKQAFGSRDDAYKNRKGQALAPLFGTVRGRVSSVTPNR